MSETQRTNRTDGDARSQLRKQQLLLTTEIDELIFDNTKTLAETLQFIINRTGEMLNARRVDFLFEYPDGLRTEVSSDPAEIGRFIPRDRSASGFSPPLSSLAAEITLDEQAIGVINVEAAADNRFDESHGDFVNAVARQISMAITHAAIFDEDNFRTATDRLLVQSAIDSETVMRHVLDRILATLSSLSFVKAEAADILFHDPQDRDSLVVAYSTNSADIGVRVDIGSSVCGEAFRTGKTVLPERASERPVVEGMRCEMAIPIILGGSNRFPIGVLNLGSERENAFSNVGRVLAQRFTRRIVNAVVMTKIRADIDSELQDQLMVLAADQVLNAVHRINNYVGSIQALAWDLLEDLESASPPDRPDVAYRLNMIRHDADQALKIPGELQKRIGTPSESVDVNAQVRVGIAAVRIPQHIELVTDLAVGLPNIPCTALDLVVENLLLNAVKAMQDRPGPLRVTTWLDLVPEPFIVITVQDTGVGMTEDELDRLFEPRQGRYRGRGLGFGMLWVRSWVRRARGLIKVESEYGSGTTVDIRFQIDPLLISRTPRGGAPT